MAKRKYKRLRLKRFLFLTFFFAAVAALLCMTPIFSIRSIVVTGNDQVSEDVICAMSNIRMGSNIFRISLKQTTASLKRNPFVHQVTYKRNLPGELVINVNEAYTQAYVASFQKYIGIDKNGKILEIFNETQNRRKPTFFGVSVKEFNICENIVIDEFKKFDIISMYMDLLESNNLTDYVTSVDLSNIEDISIVLWDKLNVKLGDESDLAYKLSYLNTLIEEIGENTRGELDMRGTGKASFKAG